MLHVKYLRFYFLHAAGARAAAREPNQGPGRDWRRRRRRASATRAAAGAAAAAGRDVLHGARSAAAPHAGRDGTPWGGCKPYGRRRAGIGQPVARRRGRGPAQAAGLSVPCCKIAKTCLHWGQVWNMENSPDPGSVVSPTARLVTLSRVVGQGLAPVRLICGGGGVGRAAEHACHGIGNDLIWASSPAEFPRGIPPVVARIDQLDFLLPHWCMEFALSERFEAELSLLHVSHVDWCLCCFTPACQAIFLVFNTP